MVKLSPLAITFVAVFVVSTRSGGKVAAFQTAAIPDATTTTGSTSLQALSRRELFSSVMVPATTAAAVTLMFTSPAPAFAASSSSSAATTKKETPNDTIAASKQKKDTTALSYQGIFTDPKHPKGYRVLVGDSKKAMMRLQDEPNGEVFNVPVKITQDKKTKTTQYIFDFSIKGGPKNVIAVLGPTTPSSSSSNTKATKTTTTLVFPDGNVWKKETGVLGVYRDGFDAKKTRVIRKEKGSKLTVDLIQSPTKTITVSAKAGTPKVLFDFPGKLQDPGTFNAAENTLSFGDGNIWTKY